MLFPQVSLLGEPPKDFKIPLNPYLNLHSLLPANSLGGEHPLLPFFPHPAWGTEKENPPPPVSGKEQVILGGFLSPQQQLSAFSGAANKGFNLKAGVLGSVSNPRISQPSLADPLLPSPGLAADGYAFDYQPVGAQWGV